MKVLDFEAVRSIAAQTPDSELIRWVDEALREKSGYTLPPKIHIVQQLTAAEIDGKMLCGYQHKFPPARGFCVYSITVFAGNHALLAFLPGFWYHGGEKHGIEVRFQ